MPHENVPLFTRSPTSHSGYVIGARHTIAASSIAQGCSEGGPDADDGKNLLSQSQAAHGFALSRNRFIFFLAVICKTTVRY